MARQPAPRRLKGRFVRAARHKDTVAIRKLWREHRGYDWNDYIKDLPCDVKEWVFYEWRDSSVK